jgi:hypothetical protein
VPDLACGNEVTMMDRIERAAHHPDAPTVPASVHTGML